VALDRVDLRGEKPLPITLGGQLTQGALPWVMGMCRSALHDLNRVVHSGYRDDAFTSWRSPVAKGRASAGFTAAACPWWKDTKDGWSSPDVVGVLYRSPQSEPFLFCEQRRHDRSDRWLSETAPDTSGPHRLIRRIYAAAAHAWRLECIHAACGREGVEPDWAAPATGRALEALSHLFAWHSPDEPPRRIHITSALPYTAEARMRTLAAKPMVKPPEVAAASGGLPPQARLDLWNLLDGWNDSCPWTRIRGLGSNVTTMALMRRDLPAIRVSGTVDVITAMRALETLS
jgi:hypothetical protein